MKLLFDENFEKTVVNYLRSKNFDVIYIGENEFATEDYKILEEAFREKRVLITNDLDFGRLVYKQKKPHSGVILFRLTDQSLATKIKALEHVIKRYNKIIANSFIVIDDQGVRIRTKK